MLETVERDLAILRDLGLTLALTLETHIHADHVTGAGRLRALTGSKAGFPAPSAAEFVDFTISEGEAVRIGGIELRPLYTPGHTDDHHAYLIENAGETGFSPVTPSHRGLRADGLSERRCHRPLPLGARQDFRTARRNARLSRARLQSAASEQCRTGESRNPRLGGGKTIEEFVAIMSGLDLPRPKKMDVAVPANRQCGGCAQPEVGLSFSAERTASARF